MKKLDEFEKVHKKSMDYIKKVINTPPENYDYGLAVLVKWMLTTDANPYGFIPSHAGCLNSSTSMELLISIMHHALYDDGDISFVKVNDEPIIVFYDKNNNIEGYIKELYKGLTYRDNLKIEILNISAEDFPNVYNEYYTNFIKECFIQDAARRGISVADQLYSTYSVYNKNWKNECYNEINKIKNFFS
jgi:hypothetical protein